MTGDSRYDRRSIQKVDDRHYKVTSATDGKPVSTASITFSPDGKTRTLTLSATDSQGKKVKATCIYGQP